MRLRTAIIFTIVVIVFQPLLLSLLPEALAPNLGFCLLVICATTMDEREVIIPLALVTAGSLFIDLFSNQFAGAVAISMIVVLIGVFSLRNHIDLENPIILLIFSVGANVIYQLVYWVIYRILGTPYGFLYMLKNLPAGIAVNTIVMFVGLFIAIRKVNQKRRESYFKKMK